MDSDVPEAMRAWVVSQPGSLGLVDLPVPEPLPHEVLVKVMACGVCRTDLHVRDGDLPARVSRVVPGHEVIGEVVGGSGHPRGLRVGIPWLRHTCGQCRFCRQDRENLCPRSRYTGWDAHGGYAEYATVPADYAYPLPVDGAFGGYRPEELAPLLCAGIIGFRAWRRTSLPSGGRLGIYGFGASAHLTAQVALAEGADVHVFTRAPAARQLARSLGVASVRGAFDESPVPLDGAILFAPVGDLVPVALSALDRGGVLVIAGIYLSEIPALDYARSLFYEREVRTVTANTRADGRDFLGVARRHRLRVAVSPYAFERADVALDDLAAGHLEGAAVLQL